MTTTVLPAVCRICGNGPTINAHLIPRALGHDLRGAAKHLFVGGVAGPGRRTVQAGLSDRNILCAMHDGILGAYDNYGIRFCRTLSLAARAPAPDVWHVPNLDGDKLVRFWLAILWRFAVSTLPEAAGVTLGPFEPQVRDVLFHGASCSVEPAVLLMRYRSCAIPAENICFPPYVSRYPGLPPWQALNACGVAVGGVHAFVKVDSCPLPAPLRALTINGKSDAVGGYLDFESTHQFRRMVQIAQNMARKPVRA